MSDGRSNNLVVDKDINRSVHRVFEAIVDQQPDAIALNVHSAAYTYGELDRASNHIARKIIEADPGQFVVTMIEEPFHAIITFLAISKTGRAWVPVYAKLPTNVLKTYIEKFKASLIAVDDVHEASASQLEVPILSVNEIPWNSDTERISLDVDPAALFGIFPTSGTTGLPKGVRRTHRDQVSRTFHAAVENQVLPLERILFTASFAFGAAVIFALRGLYNGAVLYIPDLKIDSREDVIQLIRNEKITTLTLITSLFRYLFLNVPEPLPNIRSVFVGGEPALEQDFVIFKRAFDNHTRFINFYAGTEFGIACSFVATHNTVLNSPTIPVGRVLPHTTILVVDENKNPVIDQVGEIIIITREITDGYWEMPELNEEKFVTLEPGNSRDSRPLRSYSTGDLGKMLPDGNLVHMGRADNQVKIHGYRIEIAAIENHFFSHPDIIQAVVQPHILDGATQLVAFLEFDARQTLPSISQLRNYLAEKLADYMIPTRFVYMTKIPLLANGKINRRELPDPSKTMNGDAIISSHPVSKTEKALTVIWTDVLKINQPIGRHDDIFGMGATSLKATLFLVEVNRQMEKILTPEQIYRYPTIAQLAALLDSGAECETTEVTHDKKRRIIPLQVRGDASPLFCIPGSVGNPLMFQPLARHLHPDNPVYALQPKGSDGQQLPHTSIYKWATYYRDAILTLDCNRPICLLGHSGGGFIATEVAQQLKVHGIEVKQVFLGDTHCPAMHNTLDYYSNKLRISLRHYLLVGFNRVNRIFSHDSLDIDIYKTSNIEEIRYRLKRYFKLALYEYRPLAYHGNAVYLLAKSGNRTPEDMKQSVDYWRQMIKGDFKVVDIEGPHGLFTEPYIQNVSQHIKQQIVM